MVYHGHAAVLVQAQIQDAAIRFPVETQEACPGARRKQESCRAQAKEIFGPANGEPSRASAAGGSLPHQQGAGVPGGRETPPGKALCFAARGKSSQADLCRACRRIEAGDYRHGEFFGQSPAQVFRVLGICEGGDLQSIDFRGFLNLALYPDLELAFYLLPLGLGGFFHQVEVVSRGDTNLPGRGAQADANARTGAIGIRTRSRENFFYFSRSFTPCLRGFGLRGGRRWRARRSRMHGGRCRLQYDGR